MPPEVLLAVVASQAEMKKKEQDSPVADTEIVYELNPTYTYDTASSIVVGKRAVRLPALLVEIREQDLVMLTMKGQQQAGVAR